MLAAMSTRRLGYSSFREDSIQQSLRQRTIAMMRNSGGDTTVRVRPDIMASLGAYVHETMHSQMIFNFGSCQWLHASATFGISSIDGVIRPISQSSLVSIQPCAASTIFRFTSSRVSPSEKHPGIAGISAQYRPSSSWISGVNALAMSFASMVATP